MLPPFPKPATPFPVQIESEPEADLMDVDDKANTREKDEVADVKAGLIIILEFEAHLVEDDSMPVLEDPIREAEHAIDPLDDAVNVE